jgi:hypothetical protein
MRSFKNIALLVRTKRINHSKSFSQSELSLLLGYKNGQFISNVERGLCCVPLKMMKRISEVLEIDSNELKTAILKDHEVTLTKFFHLDTKEISTESNMATTKVA